MKEFLGVEIYCGLVEDLKDQIIADHKSKVAVAIVSGSLQHMLDPLACLEAAHVILKPGGVLYICNKDIFKHYLALSSPCPRTFADLRTVDHPHYFHPEGYRQMVKRAGFGIEKFNGDSKVRFAHMEILARKEQGGDVYPSTADYEKQLLVKFGKWKMQSTQYRSFPKRLIRMINRRSNSLFRLLRKSVGHPEIRKSIPKSVIKCQYLSEMNRWNRSDRHRSDRRLNQSPKHHS